MRVEPARAGMGAAGGVLGMAGARLAGDGVMRWQWMGGLGGSRRGPPPSPGLRRASSGLIRASSWTAHSGGRLRAISFSPEQMWLNARGGGAGDVPSWTHARLPSDWRVHRAGGGAWTRGSRAGSLLVGGTAPELH